MNKVSIVLIALLGLAAAESAVADCAAEATPEGVRKAHERGQKHEKAGNPESAFHAYLAAQEYICEDNPVEGPAARRAAALALPLGKAAEQQGDYEKAFTYYDGGGHYSAADRALMMLMRARPDDPYAFGKASQVFGYRSEPAFKSNNATRLSAAGAYQFDQRNLTELMTFPPKAVERAFQKEAAAFNEAYLRDYVQLIQSRPDDPTDFDGLQRSIDAADVFHRKWGEDPLKGSNDALSLISRWVSASPDRTWGAKITAQRRQRIEQHVATLTKSYAGAPELLDKAMDYDGSIGLEYDESQARLAIIRTQAGKLGDEAMAKNRLQLASEYFSVAGQREKAAAARDKQQKLAMAKMQPQFDAMKQQAEQVRKQLDTDPEKIKAMQEQARAAQKSIQQQREANAHKNGKANAKKADDLEKELGL